VWVGLPKPDTLKASEPDSLRGLPVLLNAQPTLANQLKAPDGMGLALCFYGRFCRSQNNSVKAINTDP
jgi:hypothetical protein